MHQKKKPKIEFIIAGIFISLAVIISVEQYINWGSFFELNDIHHEMFIVMFLFGAFTILLIYYTKKKEEEKT